MNRFVNFVFVFFLFIFIGCKRNQYELIYNTIGKRLVTLATISKNSSQFTILRYVDNPLCSSCQLKLGEWKIYKKKLRKSFKDRVDIYIFYVKQKILKRLITFLKFMILKQQ